MKKVIVIGASSSKQSINKQLATYAGAQLKDVSVKVLDLNNFEMPLFSVDKEAESGVPDLANIFSDVLGLADGFIISFAEHNGNYSAAFKNILDWVSRINPKMWGNKPMLVLATSPGARGGKSVLEIATSAMPRFGAKVTGHFSLPSFGENFKEGKIKDESLEAELSGLVAEFEKEL